MVTNEYNFTKEQEVYLRAYGEVTVPLYPVEGVQVGAVPGEPLPRVTVLPKPYLLIHGYTCQVIVQKRGKIRETKSEQFHTLHCKFYDFECVCIKTKSIISYSKRRGIL